MTTATTTPPTRRDFAAVFLVSAALLLYQIALMRVLSVVIWYHYAFLVLSLVMLGLAAPGVLFSFLARPRRFLAPFLLAGGITAPLGVALIVRFGAGLETQSPLLVMAGALPVTLALGGALCLLLMRAEGASVARMYGIDLLGAGLGAVLTVPLMTIAPTPQIAAACGFPPLIALALRRGRNVGIAIAAMALLAAALLMRGPFQVTRSKAYDEAENPPVYEQWTPLARLTVFDENFFYLRGYELGFTWGRGRVLPPVVPVRQYWIEQDGSAGTPMTGFDGDLSKLTFLLQDVTSAGYQLRPVRRAAVIGAGGGRDVLTALAAGVAEVSAVEINPAIIDIVSRRFASFSGDPYHLPGVRAVAEEGRSFLTRTTDRFDLIQLSLTDSWAATTAGAYVLAENGLYTTEAFDLYMDRLTENGILSVSRWRKELPWLVNLGRVALNGRGVESPERHIVLMGGGQLATMILSRRPIDEADRPRLFDLALERGFSILYPVPRGRRAVDTLAVRVAEEGLKSLAGTGVLVKPPTDDRPYFFHIVSPFSNAAAVAARVRERTGRAPVVEPVQALHTAMISVTAAALLMFLAVPGFLMRGRRAGPLGALLAGSAYFAAIGAGFMLIENVMIQRFTLILGHPSYALSTVIAALLVGTGLGSLWAPRLGVAGLRRWGLLVPAALAVLAVLIPFALPASLGWSRTVRCGLAWIVLMPPAFGMGLFFPLGMLRFGEPGKPWFWAVNGLFGVLGSVFALGLSIEYGFGVVTGLGVGAYLVAWVAAGWSTRGKTQLGRG